MENETKLNIDQLCSLVTPELIEKAKIAPNNNGSCVMHPNLLIHILTTNPNVAAADMVNIVDLAVQEYKNNKKQQIDTN